MDGIIPSHTILVTQSEYTKLYVLYAVILFSAHNFSLLIIFSQPNFSFKLSFEVFSSDHFTSNDQKYNAGKWKVLNHIHNHWRNPKIFPTSIFRQWNLQSCILYLNWNTFKIDFVCAFSYLNLKRWRGLDRMMW